MWPTTSCMWSAVGSRSIPAITTPSRGSGASAGPKPRRSRGAQEAKAKKLQAYVDRWRYKSHTARQAQSRLKALARMQPIAGRDRRRLCRVRLSEPEGVAAAADRARRRIGRLCRKRAGAVAPKSAHRPRRPHSLWSAGTATARRRWRGCSPVSSSRWPERSTAGGKLRVGYFAQHQIEELVRRRDAAPAYGAAVAGGEARRGAQPARPLRLFRRKGQSRGAPALRRRAGRLSLALITRDAPHILILDEPTNHLDVDAREALVEALAEFGGAVVVVSHDRHLLGADRRPARAGR